MNNLDSPRPRRHKRHPHSQSDFPPLLKYVIGIFMTNTTIVALLSFFSSSDTNVHPTLRQLSIVGTSAHSKPIFPSKIETEKMSRWSGVEWSSILVRCGFATRNMFGHRHQRYFNIGWWTGPSARTNGAALQNVLACGAYCVPYIISIRHIRQANVCDELRRDMFAFSCGDN